MLMRRDIQPRLKALELGWVNFQVIKERETGIEPATSSSGSWRQLKKRTTVSMSFILIIKTLENSLLTVRVRALRR